MVANNVSSSRGLSPARPKRAPLVPSEATLDNNVPVPRRLKSRDVGSRYLSSTATTTMTSTSSSGTFSSSSYSTTTTTTTSSSNSNSNSNSTCTPRRRFPSPLVSVSSTNLMTPANNNNNINKRAQSTERRRPVTPSSAVKMLTAMPARSLSVSFQGPSFAIPLSKPSKPPPTNGSRHSTPDRRPVTPVSKVSKPPFTVSNNGSRPSTPVSKRMSTGSINGSRASTQERRPVTPVTKVSKPIAAGFNNGSRPVTPERRPVTPVRKLGISNSAEQKRWPARSRQDGFMTRSVDFSNENTKLSGSGTGTATAVRALRKSMIGKEKLKDDKGVMPEISRSIDKLFTDSDNSDRVVSDAESVSSGSTPGNVKGATPRAIMVPARFRQETVNRLRRVQPELVSPPLAQNNKLIAGNRHLKDGPARTPRGLSPSPVRGAVRPASPCKSVPLASASSPSRCMSSPIRARGAIGSNSNLGNPHSVLSFAAEARRRKVGDNAISDAHVLRMLHNKYLQWRFANARADAAMQVQRATAQKSLYNSWVTTSKMRQSVIAKQMEIQQLRQNLKLHTVLKTQIPYLKIWDQVERDHIASLSGTIVSLESSTLRVPLVDGAKVDVQSLKDAFRSAADVMQIMTSLIRSLVTKVEHVNNLASELATTTTNEQSMINQCKDLLSLLTNMEVHDCSLRTHILQLQ
ncbi:QWRF motif-containing protein 2-like [Bidens hawaiensis]|uniref:QWRF motif-containing protein 2-like n=1 Tax=Bidens hawaiensis TaxID=980011 RepID=UPI00404B29AE